MPFKDPVVRRERAREYCRRWREQHGEERRERFRVRWATDPEFRARNRSQVSAAAKAAHQRVHKALLRGEIVRATHCEECGAATFTEAAHLDYQARLAVRWLCRPCHRRWDAAHPKGAAIEPAERVYHTPRMELRDYVCAKCGVAFTARPHDRRHTNTPCCSKSCAMSYSRQQRSQKATAA